MKESDLVDEMQRRFSMNELRSVCFDAGIPYENLRHGNRLDLTLAIVEYTKRRSMQQRLFAALKKGNPAFVLVGDSIEIIEPEVNLEPPTPPINRVNEEKDRIIEALRYEPSIGAIADALVYIIGRL